MDESQITLRRAEPADAPAIVALTRAAYAKWVPLLGREPKPMAADYAVAVRDHLVDLLFVAAKLAALIEMIPQPDHLLIENLAVSPEFQGRGYGRRLVAYAEQVAASRGIGTIRLYTNKLFAENLRFYDRLGYAVVEEEDFKGGVIVHMSKKLPAFPG
ncbi:MAG TPA: GNAT family N-acetyltransferase [Terriglobia bacterium]|nr:GNAT family N-acetyltransferase [Terriglobia bacterium]